MRPMIVEIPHQISCGISTKTEILHDYGAPGSAGAAASLRTALTATTDHEVNGIAASGGERLGQTRWGARGSNPEPTD